MNTAQSQPAAAPRRQVYAGYTGKADPSERDRIVHLLQMYRSTEHFNAEYLPLWAQASPSEAMKGGLRIIQAREGVHARLIKERLRELGETEFVEVSQERRAQVEPFFASAERSDVEKLESLVHLFADVDDFFAPITGLIADIKEDLRTRELLRTILDDEYATVKWFRQMYESLAARAAQA
ncbi:MAG: hypothetical protein IAE86_02650 [Burkholderiaceae bacterium]|nr:hypothetical protein [Burkholderiaceae bacterium]